MAESDETTTLQILTLTIEDCLGCKNASVQFSPENTVHLLLYTLDVAKEKDQALPIVVTPIGNALQLMCSLEYADAESLQLLPQLNVGKGCLKMTFTLERLGGINVIYHSDSDISDLDLEPSTSRQAELRRSRQDRRRRRRRATRIFRYKVNVQRRFDNVERLDYIHFQVNAGVWHEVTVREYHNIFFVQPPHKLEIVSTSMQQQYAINWLKIIQADTKNYSILSEDGNPFDTFAKLFDRRDSEIGLHLKRLSTHCLAMNETTRLFERRFLLDIFRQARSIFEYITNYEYTVWFFVPRLNRFTPLQQLTVEDFDLSNVRTCIKLSRDESNSFSQHADHNITDILLVSLQMALAKAGKQSMLFLGQLEKLSEFVCMQYATAYFMNSIHTEDNPQSTDTNTNNNSGNQWICRRYLHRIIEAAGLLKIVVFIEYPSTLTLLPNNRQCIQCTQQLDRATGAITWNVSIGLTRTADRSIAQLRDAIDLN